MLIFALKFLKVRVFNSSEKFPAFENPVVTVGAFDGVHRGHAKILAQLVATAKRIGGESVLVTFNPHPQTVLHPESDFFLINNFEKNLSLLEANGVDNVVVIPFTKEFANVSYDRFLKDILIEKIGAKIIVMGPNHSFGKNGEGNIEKAIVVAGRYGVSIETISEFVLSDSKVRSSQIRRFITAGEIEKAEELLGHPL